MILHQLGTFVSKLYLTTLCLNC